MSVQREIFCCRSETAPGMATGLERLNAFYDRSMLPLALKESNFYPFCSTLACTFVEKNQSRIPDHYNGSHGVATKSLPFLSSKFTVEDKILKIAWATTSINSPIVL